MNIWSQLKKEKLEKADGKLTEPILVLAPMADVTDVAFRRIIAKNGKPDVMWTEFVSADGLMLAPFDNPDDRGFTSQDKLRADLKFDESEHPIVAQIFSSRIENVRKTATLVRELGFDGVDINMGCPDRSIEKQGCGSAMIKNPKSAVAVIRAAKDGVGYEPGLWTSLYKILKAIHLNFLAYKLEYKLKTNIPVTVKTRLGYNRDELETWLPALLSAWPAVITMHARTRKQMSKVAADWTRIRRAVEIRDEWFNSKISRRKIPTAERTLIFGNGDVLDIKDARKKSHDTGCDGVMLGRAIFGNPWLFSDRSREDVPVKERLMTMLHHTQIFEKELAFKNFAVMKKHYKSYTEGIDGVKELRADLMDVSNAREVETIVNNFIKELK
jgi:tRNA-dihydrouridine synthase